MSAPTDLDRIAAVLLADGWHSIELGSFRFAPFTLEGPTGSIAATGFGFVERVPFGTSGPDAFVMAPAASLLAVRVQGSP